MEGVVVRLAPNRVLSVLLGALRGITHIEGKKGETPLAVGVRDASIELSVKVKKEKAGESVSLKFPK